MADEPKPSQPNPSESSGEDLNSTMMGIDASKLNLGLDETNVRIPKPSADVQIDRQIEQKLESRKSAPVRWFRRIFAGKPIGKDREPPQLPPQLRFYQHSWFIEPAAPILNQIFFYLLRLATLAGCFSMLKSLALGAWQGSQAGHPAATIFIAAFAVAAFFCLATMVFRWAPGWLIAWPASALAVIMAWGALSYHTADPLYYTISGQPISAVLNSFYLALLVYTLWVIVSAVLEHWLARLMGGLLLAVLIAPFAINSNDGTLLEFALLGVGRFGSLPWVFLRPSVAVFQGALALLALFALVFGLMPARTMIAKISRGFMRAIAWQMIALSLLGFCLLQKNRVPHLFNTFWPERLAVGGVEAELNGRNVVIATRTLADNEGSDLAARYRFRIQWVKEKDQFLLQLVDEFDFPVKGLTRNDLVVTADNEEIRDYSLAEDPQLKPEWGNYWLTLNLAPRPPAVIWPEQKQFLPEEKLSIELAEPRIRKLQAFSEGVLVWEGEYPVAPKSIEIPLATLLPGTQSLDLALFDELDQEISRSNFGFAITDRPGLRLLSPLSEDHIGTHVTLLALPSGLPTDSITTTVFKVNGEQQSALAGFSPFATVDLSNVADGPVELTVEAQGDGGPWTAVVKVTKDSAAPALMIEKPAMGAFADRDTDVTYRLSTPKDKIAGVSLAVNGVPFTDFKGGTDGLTLPIARWQTRELYVTVQAALTNGDKVSDWVFINKGKSELKIKFDSGSLGAAEVKNVALVMDASVSALDNWQGRSKWLTEKTIISVPEVESRLQNRNPSVIVYGAKRPHDFQDCADITTLVKTGEYDKGKMETALESVKPRGVSALVSALQEAYKTVPDKIYLFTDGADSCEANLLKALSATIRKSPRVRVAVFALGRVRDRDRTELISLTQKTGGRFYQPENYQDLLSDFLDEFQLNYQLSAHNRVVNQASLTDQDLELDPGEYVLKIPFGSEIQEKKINLEHGMVTTVTVKGIGGKLQFDVSNQSM